MRAKRVARVALGVVALALTVGAILATPGYAQKETAPSGSSVPNYEYKLTKTGEFKGDKSALRRAEEILHLGEYDSVGYDGGMVVETDGGYQIMGTDGKPVLDGKVFESFKYIGHGVYCVKAPGDDINQLGLVRADGTELLPCEAARFKKLRYESMDSRFIEVVYAEGETKSKDEAFLFKHDGKRKLIGVESPGKDDTLYKGYARMFDLKKGSFVEGIELRDARVAQHAYDMGDAFAIKYASKDGDFGSIDISDFGGAFDEDSCECGDATIYDADGKQIWSKKGPAKVYPYFVAFEENGKTQVVDASGKVRYTADSSKSLENFIDCYGWWSDDYLAELDVIDFKYKVIDFDGKQVLPATDLSKVGTYKNGLFIVDAPMTDGQLGGEKVLGADGTVLADDPSMEYAIRARLPNYNFVSKRDTKNDSMSGVVAKGAKIIWEGDAQPLLYDYLGVEKDGKMLTLNDEKFSLEIEPEAGLCPALIAGHGKSSTKYGVYDLFTGKQLLKDEYESIGYGSDCVWAYANGTWTIYSVELKEL